MGNLFSSELKELISKSRDVAIDSGYDCISTIHFFLADCENRKPNSIFKFAFKEYSEFEKFKTRYTLTKGDLLTNMNESLPLTKEAEKTIQLADTERKLHKQSKTYPSHLFIAALKNRDSLLYDCFKHDNNVVANLTNYYESLSDFEKSKILPGKNDFIKIISALFKRKKSCHKQDFSNKPNCLIYFMAFCT